MSYLPKPSPPQASHQDSPTSALLHIGPEHALLAHAVGTWDVHFTHWQEPGEQPKQATAVSSIESVYDGRFVREHFTSDHHGIHFAGTGTTGYDRLAKHYVSTWYDNAGTGIVMLLGTAMPNGKMITYRGTKMCATKHMPISLRHVLAWENPDRFSVVMHARDQGDERVVMELVYNRRK